MTGTVRTAKKKRGQKGRARKFWHRASVPVLLSLSVLVILLGLLLPSVLMTRQKERLRSFMVRTDLGNDVSFAQASSFEGIALEPIRLSRLVNARYETGNVVVHEPLEGEMTEAVAIAQAVKEVARMEESALIPSYCADLEGAQYTALLSTYHYQTQPERDYDPAYDFWDISFYKTDLTVHLQLDVLSGKILSFEAMVFNANLQRVWDIENGYPFEMYGYAGDIAYEFDGAEEVKIAEAEAWGYPERIERVVTGVLLSDGSRVELNSIPEGIRMQDITELAVSLVDEKGTELEQVTLKEELSLISFSDDFDRLQALGVYMEDYLGLASYIDHEAVELYADTERAYYEFYDAFLEAEIASDWREANWYISYHLY